MNEEKREAKASDKPWQVWAGDVIRSGHPSEDQATAAAAAANQRAADLGIRTRYDVRGPA